MAPAVPGRLPLDFSSALAKKAEQVAADLEDHAGGPSGWRPLRLIFRHFWLFDQEAFRFVHGRLFLRGANASGKSTVLAAAVPLVLDGNRARHRLDTFGGSGRTLQYFLLGPESAAREDDEAFYHEQRTGYIALEFVRPAPADGGSRHLTIGIGLHCSRHRDSLPVTFWGFCIHDGRRIGLDLDVVGTDGTALRRQDLEQVLGTGGRVVSTESAYRDLVNDALFGFDDAADLSHLLRLLLELRAPKLNRDMGPRVVSELLADSLPPVDTSLFAQLRTILEQIDDHTDRCAELRRRHAAVSRLDDAITLVQSRRAEACAARYLEALGRLRQARAWVEASADQWRQAEAAWRAAQAHKQATEAQAQVVDGQLQALRESQVLKAEEALASAGTRLGRAEGRVRDRARRVAELEARSAQTAQDAQRQQAHWVERACALHERADAYLARAEATAWPLARDAAHAAHAALEPAWSAPGGGEPDPSRDVRAAWFSQAAAAREGALLAVRSQLMEHERAEARQRTVQARFDLAHDHTREAREVQAAAEQTLSMMAEEAATAVRGWWTDLAALRLDAAPVEVVGDRLRAFRNLRVAIGTGLEPPRVAIEAGLQPLRAAIAQHRREADRQRVALQRRHDDCATALTAKEQELQAWEAQTEATPGRSAGTLAARAHLSAAGIAARPFYETRELDPTLPPEAAARIEAACEQAGLLDALVVAPAALTLAQTCLAAAGLGDVFLTDTQAAAQALTAAEAAAAFPLTAPDPVPTGAVTEAGRATDRPAETRFQPNGTWRHGVLGGVSATADLAAGPRYFGVENRRQRHRERLAQLRAEREAMSQELAAAQTALQEATVAKDLADGEAEALAHLPALAKLDQATIRAFDSTTRAKQAQRAEDAEGTALSEAAQEVSLALRALEALQEPLPETRGRTAAGLDGLVAVLRAAVDACRETAAAVQGLNDAEAGLRAARAAVATAHGDLEAARTELQADQADMGREQAAERELRDLIESPEGRQERERYRFLRQEELRLRDAVRLAAEETATLAERAAHAGERQQAAEAAAAAAAAPEDGERQALEAQLAAYPTLAHHLEALRAGPAGAEVGARALLSRRHEDDRQLERITADLSKARVEFVRVEVESREALADYLPEWNAELDLVRLRGAGPAIWPFHLREELRVQRLQGEELLRESERQLYEDFLLHQLRESLHTRIRATEDWTEDINRDLREAPLSSGEVLALRWAPVPGAGIAAHLGLLRADPAMLRPEERQALGDAFRGEVERVRREDREQSSELGFAEALEEAMDYRRWFRFEIVSRAPHQKPTIIDDRRFSTRSGAEKSLALVLPLVAAAAARYDLARPDAPRLIAFDEAFAGVDLRNVGESLGFLCRFGFSWVMASERLWGVGAALPAAATYELMRRGNVVVALPFLWDGARLVDIGAALAGDTAEGGA